MKLPAVNARQIDQCASSMNAASARPEFDAQAIDTCASSMNASEAVAKAEPTFQRQAIDKCASSMSAPGHMDSFTTASARPDYSKYTG